MTYNLPDLLSIAICDFDHKLDMVNSDHNGIVFSCGVCRELYYARGVVRDNNGATIQWEKPFNLRDTHPEGE
jgi:hypothetical protein